MKESGGQRKWEKTKESLGNKIVVISMCDVKRGALCRKERDQSADRQGARPSRILCERRDQG